jgi:hypothetical protein
LEEADLGEDLEGREFRECTCTGRTTAARHASCCLWSWKGKCRGLS